MLSRRRSFGRRPARRAGGVRHQVKVAQFAFCNTVAVAPSDCTAPVVSDTPIISFVALSPFTEPLMKDIKVLAAHYDLDIVNPNNVENVLAFGLVRDCIYEDAIAPGTSAPVHAGTPFLFLNELIASTDETLFPRRIFFRRAGHIQQPSTDSVTHNVLHVDSTLRPDANYAQRRVRINARLGPDDVLVHRLELTNATAGTIELHVQVLMTLAYMVRT